MYEDGPAVQDDILASDDQQLEPSSSSSAQRGSRCSAEHGPKWPHQRQREDQPQPACRGLRVMLPTEQRQMSQTQSGQYAKRYDICVLSFL